MRTRAETRKNSIKKALRKRRIDRETRGDGSQMYDNLHEYSKGKIHCSCPMCRQKTRPKKMAYGSKAEMWKNNDLRRFDSMRDDMLEYGAG